MNPNTANQEAIEQVRDLIKGIDTAMLTTVSDEGLVSRPMKTQEVEFDGDLWFLTKKDTGKFHELLRYRQVNVSYAGKSFVSIRGEAELVESSEKVKQFWSPAYEELLETTYDDPNIVLIKVKAETAEYWDSGNKFKLAKFLFRRLLGKNNEGTDINRIVEIR
ncbi:pyridoxamine 5'-phosphate oxidase family protein [Paenibacillus oceani]|uniref:Pyridoxamine 5'-phosphate oxidase family protein n=1 Tax=Paenibacillus oceani TaxID=2772510 RepID=A0A927CBE8_9BACL|nr:pyridoxamine 5'-phosphate oxidase family protein [Paenibacillus oceani]MBD2864943.1 pyridoxamine 5'-phosphate oxidase family protein [Paenibacillus oceani]